MDERDNGSKALPTESAAASIPPEDSLDPVTLIQPGELSTGPFSRFPAPFGRYRVDRRLGQGAMGAVFLALDTQLDRPVALKVPHVAGVEGSDVVNRLIRESKAAAALGHPNICRVYDAGVEAGIFFIAMEYIEGRQLSDFISATEPQEERRCVHVIRKLAGGLAEAHAKGIIHRDIKPANILVNMRGEPVLTDFGLARITHAPLDGRATQSGMLVGSPSYMSPEQATGDVSAIGPRSDIYALGTVLFEMLTGRLPFEGSLMAVLAQIATKEVPAPSSFRPGIDSRLDQICQRMMAKRPDDRPASMNDVVRELGDWLKSNSVKPGPADASRLNAADWPADAKPSKVARAKVGPNPEAVGQMERQARKLASEHNYAAAIPLLEKLSGLTGANVSETAGWAKNELPTVRKKQQALLERVKAAVEQARAFLQARDYHQAVQKLESLPAAAQTDEVRQLLSEATEKYEDCMALKDQIDEAVRRKKYERLLPLVERYLALDPDNRKMQRLARNLAQSSADRAARNYAGASRYFDVAGRLVEPKEAALGLGVVALLLVGVNWMIQSYVDEVQARAAARQAGTRAPGGTDPDGGGLARKMKGPLGPPPKALMSPFSADEARAAQSAWAKHLGIPVEYVNSIGMKFRLIPPGEFVMGSTADEVAKWLPSGGGNAHLRASIQGEAPAHKVVLTKPFYLATYEVTQREYQEVLGKNPSSFSPNSEQTDGRKDKVAGLDTARHPVERVSWDNAAEFCRRLNLKEQRPPMYARVAESTSLLDGDGYQLPSEAQWEYAAAAGTTTSYWSGDTEEDAVRAGWSHKNSDQRTHPVGELAANPFGLFDVHGNVFEWVQDAWDPDFYGRFKNDAATDPFATGAPNSERVFRGGNWYNGPVYGRSSSRNSYPQTTAGPGVGFRIALSVDAVAEMSDAEAKDRPVSPPMAQGKGRSGQAPKALAAPFSIDEAHVAQSAWANHLGVPVEHVNSIGMKFLLIPPGEFVMGSTAEQIQGALRYAGGNQPVQDCMRSEAPQHKVVLTKPFYLGAHEVTQANYQQILGANPSFFSPVGKGKDLIDGRDTSRHPVETVSWEDAAEFCRKLSVKEQRKPTYVRLGDAMSLVEGDGYQLPTEAQWEFAARAGTTSVFWSGDKGEDLTRVSWTSLNSSKRSHVVGELPANAFGLFDVHGNVYEWVQDGWEPTFYARFGNEAAIDPFAPPASGSQRVLRGGNWNNPPAYCRASYRYANIPTFAVPGIGFRIALPVEAVQSKTGQRK